MYKLYWISLKNNIKSIKKFTIMMENLTYLFNNTDKIIKINNQFSYYEFNLNNKILFKIPKNIVFISSFYIELKKDIANYNLIIEEIELFLHIFKEFFPYNFNLKIVDNENIEVFKFDDKYLLKSYWADIINNKEKKIFIDEVIIWDLKIQLDLFLKHNFERGINSLLDYINNITYLNYEILEIQLKELLNKIRSHSNLNSSILNLADSIINKIKKNQLLKHDMSNKFNNLDLNLEKLLEIKKLNEKTKDYLLFILNESNDFEQNVLIFYLINKDDNLLNFEKFELNQIIEKFLDKYFKNFYKISEENLVNNLIIHFYIINLIVKNNENLLEYPSLLYGLYAFIDEVVKIIIKQNLNFQFQDNIDIIELIKYIVKDYQTFENNDMKIKILEKLKTNFELKIKGDKFEVWDKDFFLNIIDIKLKEIYDLIVSNIN